MYADEGRCAASALVPMQITNFQLSAEWFRPRNRVAFPWLTWFAIPVIFLVAKRSTKNRARPNFTVNARNMLACNRQANKGWSRRARSRKGRGNQGKGEFFSAIRSSNLLEPIFVDLCDSNRLLASGLVRILLRSSETRNPQLLSAHCAARKFYCNPDSP